MNAPADQARRRFTNALQRLVEIEGKSGMCLADLATGLISADTVYSALSFIYDDHRQKASLSHAQEKESPPCLAPFACSFPPPSSISFYDTGYTSMSHMKEVHLPTPNEKLMTLEFTIRLGNAESRYMMLNAGLDMTQRFGLKHLTFDQVVTIQKRFHQLAEQIAAEFQPTAAELEQWAADQSKHF